MTIDAGRKVLHMPTRDAVGARPKFQPKPKQNNKWSHQRELDAMAAERAMVTLYSAFTEEEMQVRLIAADQFSVKVADPVTHKTTIIYKHAIGAIVKHEGVRA